jgi:hypothetical protein
VIRSIVAITGLAGHALGSWRSPISNEVWLRDYLPKDIPNTRVLTYGYNTTILKSKSKASIEHLALNFLESLKSFRRSRSVCHTSSSLRDMDADIGFCRRGSVP